MSFESFKEIYRSDEGTTLRAKKGALSVKASFKPEENKSYRLFTVGETEQFYLWKNEPDCPFLYRMLTDALDTKHAIRDRYCLDLSSRRFEDYKRQIFKKVLWKPVMLSYLEMKPVPTEWVLGITASAENLKIKKGGYVQMRLDIRYASNTVDPKSVSSEPDQRIIINIPEGTYWGERLEKQITIPLNTANVCVFIEGIGYRGRVYLEQPTLKGNGYDLLPAFTESVADDTHMDWTAQYLSRKEWPEFRVRLNGQVIYTGEIFERCHRFSEWEIDLPKKLLRDDNIVSYELISDYHEPLPYTVYQVGIIEQPDSALDIIAVSEIAACGGHARVLIRTQMPDVKVTLQCNTDAISGKSEWHFKEKGLHGILIDCLKPCENAEFTVSAKGKAVKGNIKRIVIKQDDKVITGTGDMVYVHQDEKSAEEYLSWYLSNGIGDLVTVRCVYRWAGTRTIDRKMWKSFRRLMNELELKYVVMVDGRELPGLSVQPDTRLIGGKGFLGMQMHERDGAQFYWGKVTPRSLTDEQWINMMELQYKEAPENTASYKAENFYYFDGVMNMYADRREFDDYCEEHKKSVSSLKRGMRKTDTRHTGPSSAFKYMYEAGYKWLGAETMYTSIEPLMAFLRGASKNMNTDVFGVHHAVQWSSSPHDSIAKYRRYRLALYLSYIEGATDINTEEGLWRIEEYYTGFNRFSDTCINYKKQQQDFYRYVSSHTRSGKLFNPVALIHGREDCVLLFGEKNWGMGKAPTLADDSWELLKTVYPDSKPFEPLYVHNCPENERVGYYSRTPYGNVDVIPVESGKRVYNDYRGLVFMGYNRLEENDSKRILSYVRGGGRLLLCYSHLTVSSLYSEVKSGNLKFDEALMSLSNGTPQFIKDTVNGIELFVLENIKQPTAVLQVTDSGRPLVCTYKIGKGEVVIFHTKEYPAHTAIRPLYEKYIDLFLTAETEKEDVWIESRDAVQFALYDQGDGTRHIYVIAVDWYDHSDTLRLFTLRIGNESYALGIPFGVMYKCVCVHNLGAWAESEDGEVLSVKEDGITVQGTGRVTFAFVREGTVKRIVVDFTESNVQTVEI